MEPLLKTQPKGNYKEILETIVDSYLKDFHRIATKQRVFSAFGEVFPMGPYRTQKEVQKFLVELENSYDYHKKWYAEEKKSGEEELLKEVFEAKVRAMGINFGQDILKLQEEMKSCLIEMGACPSFGWESGLKEKALLAQTITPEIAIAGWFKSLTFWEALAEEKTNQL